jgi:hypothetical protein
MNETEVGAKTLPIRLVLTALPYKGNRYILGTLFCITEYQSALKPVSTESTFCVWVPTACSVVFLKTPSMQFYLGRCCPRITEMCVFKKIAMLFVGANVFGARILYSRSTDINS